MTPKISVVMPVYNGGEFLPAAVESILGQTFGDFEFIAVDDGSTDDTPARLAAYAEADPRVRVVTKDNGGIVSALNRGVTEARADVIARMDDDDISLPDRFARQFAHLEADPDCVGVSCEYLVIHRDGRVESPRRRHRDEPSIDFELLFHNPIGGHSQMMLRRDAVLDAGAYRPDEQLAEDYGLWGRLSDRGRFHVLPEVLHHYRRNPSGLSRTRTGEQLGRTSMVAAQRRRSLFGDDPAGDVADALSAMWAPQRGAALPSGADLEALSDILPVIVERYVDLERPHATPIDVIRDRIARQFRELASSYGDSASAARYHAATWLPDGQQRLAAPARWAVLAGRQRMRRLARAVASGSYRKSDR